MRSLPNNGFTRYNIVTYSGVCITNKTGSVFDHRIYWTFITTGYSSSHKSLSDTSSSDWTHHRDYSDFQLLASRYIDSGRTTRCLAMDICEQIKELNGVWSCGVDSSGSIGLLWTVRMLRISWPDEWLWGCVQRDEHSWLAWRSVTGVVTPQFSLDRRQGSWTKPASFATAAETTGLS
jgi:hypothetical protein